jgi:Mce-associated membrane protein
MQTDNKRGVDGDWLALAEQAEADAAEAEAVAAAARARARAIRLRHAARSTGTNAEKADAIELTGADKRNAHTAEAPAKPRGRRLNRPRLRHVFGAFAVLVVSALLVATGYMMWQDHHASLQRQRTAEFTAAARSAVVTLMSIDFNKAKEDVQRIIDNSTGQFKTDFRASADGVIKVAQDAKVITTGSVQAAAVKSMTNNSAVVLVAMTSNVTNAVGAKQEPRTWRLSVTVVREGSQIRLSNVEFVP